MNEQKRSWLRLGAIFLSGLLIGVLVTLTILQRRAERFFEGRDEFMPRRFMHRIEQKLDLDENQRQAWKIVAEHELKPQLREMHRQQRQATKDLLLGGLDKLEPRLSVTQQARLLEIRQRWQRPHH